MRVFSVLGNNLVWRVCWVSPGLTRLARNLWALLPTKGTTSLRFSSHWSHHLFKLKFCTNPISPFFFYLESARLLSRFRHPKHIYFPLWGPIPPFEVEKIGYNQKFGPHTWNPLKFAISNFPRLLSSILVLSDHLGCLQFNLRQYIFLWSIEKFEV